MTASLDDLPADALAFIRQELAAGNSVLEILRPPAGVAASVYVMLARPCQAGSSETAGAIRQFGSVAPGLPAVVVLGAEGYTSDPVPEQESEPVSRPGARGLPTMPALQRFVHSMNIDYNAWREGIGYDLDAIDEATPAQRALMLERLLETALRDWRDIEAVARIGGRIARRALRRVWREGSATQRMAILRRVPEMVTERQRAAALVNALAETRLYEGLSECLDEVAECHPPAVMQALWAALERPEAEVTVHVAAMLSYLHGLADQPFDWHQRAFFLRFGSEDAAERQAARNELRRQIGSRAA